MTENATRERRIEAAQKAITEHVAKQAGWGFIDDAAERAHRTLAIFALDAADAVSEPTPRHSIEEIARAFHEEYERRAGEFGWETQERSRVEWEDVPDENRRLMEATITALVRRGFIPLAAAPEPPTPEESMDSESLIAMLRQCAELEPSVGGVLLTAVIPFDAADVVAALLHIERDDE